MFWCLVSISLAGAFKRRCRTVPQFAVKRYRRCCWLLLGWFLCDECVPGTTCCFSYHDIHTGPYNLLPDSVCKNKLKCPCFISMIVLLVGLNIKIPIPQKKSRAHPIFQYSLKPSNKATFFCGRPSPSCKSKNPTRILPTLVSTKTCQPFWPPKQSIPKCLIRIGSQTHYFLAC